MVWTSVYQPICSQGTLEKYFQSQGTTVKGLVHITACQGTHAKPPSFLTCRQMLYSLGMPLIHNNTPNIGKHGVFLVQHYLKKRVRDFFPSISTGRAKSSHTDVNKGLYANVKLGGGKTSW